MCDLTIQFCINRSLTCHVVCAACNRESTGEGDDTLIAMDALGQAMIQLVARFHSAHATASSCASTATATAAVGPGAGEGAAVTSLVSELTTAQLRGVQLAAEGLVSWCSCAPVAAAAGARGSEAGRHLVPAVLNACGLLGTGATARCARVCDECGS
jgi:hypothetical protein